MSPRVFEPPPTLRIPFVRRCTLKTNSKSWDGMLLDLSLKGVYVASDHLLSVNDSLVLSFGVPGNILQLNLPGTVVWVQEQQTHPVHGLPPGFGVSFERMEVEDVRMIARAIQQYCLSNPIYRQYL